MTSGWLEHAAVEWPVLPAKSVFTERRESSNGEDVHLTPSQIHGVLPQSEYMQLTQTQVVQNLTGQDSMKHVEPDDFIIHLRSFQGGIEHSRHRGKVSTAYTVLTPGRDAEPRYFRWLLKSDGYIQELRTTVNQLRDGQSIKYRDFAKVALPLPPLAHQRAIADYLDRETAQIDTLIEEQQRLIEQLRDRRTAVIFEAVTRGLDPGATSRGTGVDWCPEVPIHWATKRLKHSIQSSVTGIWGSDPRGSDDDILCVRVADFDRPRLRVRDEIPTVRSVPEKDRIDRLLAPGDLLIEKSGGTAINPVGFVGIFDGAGRPAVSANFLARLRLREGQDERFWLYAHAAAYSSRLTARSVRQTTGIQNLDLQSYLNEHFPFPPSVEQKQIAEYLDHHTARIDQLLGEAGKVIELARERRSALITAAATGQLDVGATA